MGDGSREPAQQRRFLRLVQPLLQLAVLAQALDHLVEGLGQVSHLVRAGDGERYIQLALRHLVRSRHQHVHRLRKTERKVHQNEHTHQHRGDYPEQADHVSSVQELLDFLAQAARLEVANNLVTPDDGELHGIGPLLDTWINIHVLEFG